MISIFIEFLKFIKTPYLTQKIAYTTSEEKFKVLSTLLILCILYTLMLLFLLLFLYHKEVLDLRSIEDIWKYEEDIFWLVSLITIVFIVPFLEELIFRLPLTYKMLYLKECLVLLLVFILLKILSYHHDEFSTQIFFIYFLWALTFLFIVYALLLHLFQQKKVGRIYEKHPQFIVYFSVFLFSFSHILAKGNFLSVSLFLILLLISTIYVFGGFAISFIRVNLGFIWGFLLHVCYNFVFIISQFLLKI